jgi:predicted DNA-binding ribbon-helix-helix protein
MKPRRSFPSANRKRSVKLDGRKTSLGLEDGFWNALKEIAAAQNTSANQLILRVARDRKDNILSSAIRLFVLDYYRRKVSASKDI